MKETFEDNWISTRTGRICLDAHENLKISSSFCEKSRRPILIDVRSANPLTPETRAAYSDTKISKSFSGLAMVSLSNMNSMSRRMVNIYLQVARLSIPTKIFDDIDQAKAWLKNYLM